MRIAIALLLLLHGALQLLGFLKPWRLAAVPQLTGRTQVPLSETDAVARPRGRGGREVLYRVALEGRASADAARVEREPIDPSSRARTRRFAPLR